MNARMSRLRRSLSRSVHQLQAMSRSNSLADLVATLTPSTATSTFNSTLANKFATPANFPQLRQLVANSNDTLREVIDIFEEKASLDQMYAKSLRKLSTRLHKATQNVENEIDRGWTSMAEQFDVHATLHANLGTAISEDVVQPLRSIQTSEQKTIRGTEVFVEREIRKLKDKKEECARLKRTTYNASKELEKVEQAADTNRDAGNKNAIRKRKLQEQVAKSETDYISETIELEKQRRATDAVLRRGVESLEAVERQRLAHAQTALGRLQRRIAQMGPSLHQMFDRQTNNLDLAVQADANTYLSNLQPSTSAAYQVTLIDLYAENFGELFEAGRRRSALARAAAHFDAELQRLRANGRVDLQTVSGNQVSLIEFLELLYHKVNEALNSMDALPSRGYHRLTRFQHKLRDKYGLPQTVLTIPLDEHLMENTEVPPTPDCENTYNSDDYEEYEAISDEGYTSNSRQTTLIDDPVETSQIGRVLYDFMPNTEDEIAVRAGDCVIVEERLGDDWLVGHVINDRGRVSRSGRFPTSYVAF